MKKFLLALIFATISLDAYAQGAGGPGPGPTPSPWVAQGSTVSPAQSTMGITIPSTVTGGNRGAGTLNATQLFQNGVQVNTNALPTGQIWIGNGDGVAAPQTLTGDVTLTTGGLVTVTDLAGVTNGSLANSGLANSSTTVNGQTCTLGSTCTISAASTVINVGTTSVTSGTSNGLLFNNAGVLGNLATANSSVLVTNGLGVPSLSTMLPAVSGVNLTSLNASALASGTVPLTQLPGSGVTTINGTSCPLGSSCAVVIPDMSVDSMSALKALTSRPAITTMTGYYSGSVRGGGQFKWVAGDNTIPNDCSVVQPTSGPAGRFFLIYSGTLNPEQCGADATATTDSAAAVNTAMSICSNACEIQFPPGKFRMDSQITYTFANARASINLSGAGIDATTLYWPNASGGMKFTWTNIANSIHFRDMTMSTAQQGVSKGVELFNNNVWVGYQLDVNKHFDRMSFRGDDNTNPLQFWDEAIHVTGINFVNFTNSLFYGGVVMGARSGRGIVLEGPSGIITANYNIIGSSLLNLDTAVYAIDDPQGIAIVNSALVDNEYGLATQLGGTELQGITIANSNFDNRKANIHLRTQVNDLQLTGNTFLVQCGAPSPSSGVILDNVPRFTVVGNLFTAFGSGCDNALTVGDTQGWAASVSGNQFNGAFNVAIELTSNASLVLVKGNNYGTAVVTKVTDIGTNNTVDDLQASNSVLANATSSPALAAASSVPSCSSANNALSWTTNVGFGCNSSIAARTVNFGSGTVVDVFSTNYTFVASPTVNTLGLLVGNAADPTNYYNNDFHTFRNKTFGTVYAQLSTSLFDLSVPLHYGGVTLSNSVTGTGGMALSASPTFTGTVGAADVTATGTVRANTGFSANGTAGVSKTVTVRDAAGTGTCTLVFTTGLYTGGTC